METMQRLVIIIGSVREGRFGPVAAAWVAEQARQHGGFAVQVVDLADFDIPTVMPAVSPKQAGDDFPRPDGMAPLTAALQQADAYLIVTPEYNHSFPASLKAAIDWHFTQWKAKPVAFASYGNVSGGQHAVMHLHTVLTELYAVPIAAGMVFPNYYFTWEDGQPLDPDASGIAKSVLDQLSWWARALRTARDLEPHPG